MNSIFKQFGSTLIQFLLALSSLAQDAPSEVTIINNINICDGINEQLLEGYDALVVRNLIKQVAKDIPTKGNYALDVKTGGLQKKMGPHDCVHTYTVDVLTEENVERKKVKVNAIDGGGRTLVPGFIDLHWHMMRYDNVYKVIHQNDWEYNAAMAMKQAELSLMRGFITVRDAGGPFGGIKPTKQYGLKKSWDMDTFGSLDIQKYRQDEWTARAMYYTPCEILVQATSLNAGLPERAGKRDPYLEGTLGDIQPVVTADLVIAGGNPLEDISLHSDPVKNRKLIMKDGKIYKYDSD